MDETINKQMTVRYIPTMKRILSLIIIFITLQQTFGQDLTNRLILTKDKNDKWIGELETKTLSEQLTSIATRILLDTNIYVRSRYNDRIKLQDESDNSKKIESFGRPLIVVDGKCEYYSLNINNRTSNKSLKQLSDLINENYIERVTICKDAKAIAIYGSRATAGVIILTIKDKMTCKQIKKIDFGQL